MGWRIYIVQGKKGWPDSEGYSLWATVPIPAPNAKVARQVFVAMYPAATSIKVKLAWKAD